MQKWKSEKIVGGKTQVALASAKQRSATQFAEIRQCPHCLDDLAYLLNFQEVVRECKVGVHNGKLFYTDIEKYPTNGDYVCPTCANALNGLTTDGDALAFLTRKIVLNRRGERLEIVQ